MRIVCDTNILVRTILSPTGAAAELVQMIATDHSLILSLPILGEVYDVLRRPRIHALHRLNDTRVKRIVSHLYKLSTIVPLPATLPAIVPLDPKDNPIVMTAIAGKAEVLCTLDHHLHQSSVKVLCRNHGIRILRDTELLAELRT